MLKIIVKCLTREYFHPKDILKEFENSPIYSIINCKTDVPISKAKSNLAAVVTNDGNDQKDENSNDENSNDELRIESSDDDNYCDLNNDNYIASDSENIIEDGSDDATENNDDNLNIIDIYLNNSIDKVKNNELMDDKEYSKLGQVLKFIIPIFIIVFVTVVSVLLIRNLYNKDKDAVGGNIISDQNNNPKDNSQDVNNDNNSDEDSSKDDDNNQSQLDSESEFKLYLNDELIKKIGYTGKTAVIDTENYNKGTSSLLIENDTDENIKVLFAVIDFSNEKLSYMKNNQIGIAAKFKALKDVDAKLLVEAYMDDKLSVNKSGKIQIFDDIWSQKEITIDVGNIDRVNLYIEYAGKNKIWIDTLAIDILK